MSHFDQDPAPCIPQWVRARICREARKSNDILDGVRAKVFAGMASVPRDWEQVVVGRSIYWERAYRETLDAALPRAVTPHYVLLYRQGVPFAAYCAQSLLVDDDILALRERTTYQARQRLAGFDQAGRWLRNRALGLLGRRVLVIGNLYACGPYGACSAPGHPADMAWRLLPAAVAALRNVFDAPHFVIVKDFDAKSRSAVPALAKLGFSQIPIEPSMELECALSWRGHDDYLEALNTKYRKAARNVYQAVAAAGIEAACVQDVSPFAARLHALYLAVESRAQIRFGTHGPDYLPRLAAALGPERVRCTILRRGGEIVGFSFAIKDDETAIAHVVGFDYAENASAPIYLRLLHGLIEDGLAMGCSRIHYGRTALEPKARLGARPMPTEIWLRHTNPILNLAVAPLLALVPQDSAPQRQPFRKATD